jgi:hypothetical protein
MLLNRTSLAQYLTAVRPEPIQGFLTESKLAYTLQTNKSYLNESCIFFEDLSLVELNPSSEAASFAATQQLPSIL